MARKIAVLRDLADPPEGLESFEVVPLAELRSSLRSIRGIRWLWRYEEARMLAPDLHTMTKPLKSGILLRLLARRRWRIEDQHGAAVSVTAWWVVRRALDVLADAVRLPGLLRDLRRDMAAVDRPTRVSEVDLMGPPVYLRTDFLSSARAGGSVAHTAGVVNALARLGHPPIVISVGGIPTIDPEIEQHRLRPPRRFWEFAEVPSLFMNRAFLEPTIEALDGRKPAFVYQRDALMSYSGLRLARRLGVPFVLEFNGSEVWVSRNWADHPVQRDAWASEIEALVLRRADLVVVVSERVAEQAKGLGGAADRILVVPNGVDPDVYRPDVDGSGVRESYGLDTNLVVGFIGTFGAWHGAEVLAEAFGILLRRRPDLRNGVRLLMVGDGARMPDVRKALLRSDVAELAVLSGAVPQDRGPSHLAACDVLASPHVPNPDGTPFFGSPTKLFEYMAMGRGIVASDLEQIGQVLEDEETALLVSPGDANDLARGLEQLVDDPELRARLGKAAREVVVARYTWTAHTRKILRALETCTA